MGSGSGKTYKYIPDYTSSNALAERYKLEWQDYKDKYLPVVTSLPGEIGPHHEEIAAAGVTAQTKSDQSAQEITRNLLRYGVQLNPIQREAVVSQIKNSAVMNRAIATNLARRGINERNEALTENLVDLGSQVKGMSNSALEGAAELEAQRNQQGYQIAAAKTAKSQANYAGKMGLVQAGLGAATMAAMMS
jgi:hypothetical protein